MTTIVRSLAAGTSSASRSWSRCPNWKDRVSTRCFTASCPPASAFVGREVPIRVDRHGRGALDDAFYTFIYSPLRDASGRSRRRRSCWRSMSPTRCHAKRQTEELAQKLRDSEAQFHVLAESIPQLAWSTRADGYIDWYNQRWYDYTGTTLREHAGLGLEAGPRSGSARRGPDPVAGGALGRRAVRDGVSAARSRRPVSAGI